MSSEAQPEVLALTPQWLAVSKPSGWLTIPGRGVDSFPILSEWAKEHYSSIWVIHRLDRDTSGVVLFARSAQDHQLANQWFQTRITKKIYHCLAAGQPAQPIIKLQAPIEGAPSLTQVEVKEKFDHCFFAQILLKTGRRHQIRIHLSQKGYPLLGDVQYSGPTQIQGSSSVIAIPRVALHASILELPSGETFKAPLPKDFQEWLELLRKEKNRD
jgi:23S rRNA pseudouridine1911/1915/1917 synthase